MFGLLRAQGCPDVRRGYIHISHNPGRRVHRHDGAACGGRQTGGFGEVNLAEVCAMLKRDAKDMLQDLLDGVSLGRYTACMSFGVAVLATHKSPT